MEPVKVKYAFKIIAVGDSEVGKSSLLLKYAKDTFLTEQQITIGVDFFTKQVNIPNEQNKQTPIKLQLWDTAGQEKFRALIRIYYRDCSGVILVFDVTRRDSFINLEHWMDIIDTECSKDTLVILIGNKIDLPDRVVSREEAQAFAHEYNINYFETSAKETTSSSIPINILAQDILFKAEREYPNLPPGVKIYETDGSYKPTTIKINKRRARGRGIRSCCS